MSMPMQERFSSSFTRKAYAMPAAKLREPSPADLDATLPVLARPVPASEVLPMRCLGCQGAIQRATAPVTVARNGYRLAWKDVPAWVCSHCGTAYFERGEVERVRKAVLDLGRSNSA